MKQAINSWSATCAARGANDALVFAQARIAEVVHWTSATVHQARSWAAVANDSANVYAARLVAAAGVALDGLKKP